MALEFLAGNIMRVSLIQLSLWLIDDYVDSWHFRAGYKGLAVTLSCRCRLHYVLYLLDVS
jgi:hypothetical protein